ncbi:hypothetical protein B296_00025495 [Ensete ventricosum]|uniref:Uncharacterized protein n=1 Tax=Ensete ventricosum TaxID=4639 RepID=A0A426YSB7_ENSVE|nr:hypothetical protein B296_00025495 [Ensete ventricosum]
MILHTGLFRNGRGVLMRSLRCLSQGRIKNYPPGRVMLRVLEREFLPTPFTCYRNGCFIPVGGKLVRTPDLTSVIPRGMIESYGGRAAAEVGGEGVARHTSLMTREGAGQCRTQSPPPRMLDQQSTWSFGLTWLPPGCCRG